MLYISAHIILFFDRLDCILVIMLFIGKKITYKFYHVHHMFTHILTMITILLSYHNINREEQSLLFNIFILNYLVFLFSITYCFNT